MVRDVRSGLRHTLLSARGRAQPISSATSCLRSRRPPPLPPGRGGGPRCLIPGDAAAPLSVRKRAREQAGSVLRRARSGFHDTTRYDDIVEGQIGDDQERTFSSPWPTSWP